MRTYENAHFGLRIDVPEKWKLVSWKHTKIGPSWRSAYQTRDDDLPKKGGCVSKFLFTAGLHAPESEAIVDADIEISVFRLPLNEDLRKSLFENFERQRADYESKGIATSVIKEGVWTIKGVDLGYVDQQSNSRSGQSRYRFFFRRVDDEFWLYGKIAGHKKWAFEEALRVVEGMEWRGARRAEPDVS